MDSIVPGGLGGGAAGVHFGMPRGNKGDSWMRNILTITLPEGRLVVEFDDEKTVTCKEGEARFMFVDEEAILVSDFTPKARVTPGVLCGHRKVRVGRGLTEEEVEGMIGIGGVPRRNSKRESLN